MNARTVPVFVAEFMLAVGRVITDVDDKTAVVHIDRDGKVRRDIPYRGGGGRPRR